MRIKDFARLLDTHGADPSRWPAAERPAARAMLETSAEARQLRDRAARLDGALRGSLPEPDAETLARMRARVAMAVARAPLPARPPLSRTVLDWLRPLAPAGCGALVALTACLLWLNWTPATDAGEVLGAPRVLAMMDTAQ